MTMTEHDLEQPLADKDTLIRGVLVLETLAGMEQPASLSNIAGAMNLSKSSTYRILRSLQSEGFVSHSGRTGYRIAGRSVALASLIGPRPEILVRARPILRRLMSMTSESVMLYLRSGPHRVLILGVEPPAKSGRRPIRIGERAPLVTGCSGRSMLAYLSQREIDNVLNVPALSRHVPWLRQALATIRENGYGMSFSALYPGINSVGAPLIDPEDGRPLGSMVISGPDNHMHEAVLRMLAPTLMSACSELAPQLAAILGSRPSVPFASMNPWDLRKQFAR